MTFSQLSFEISTATVTNLIVVLGDLRLAAKDPQNIYSHIPDLQNGETVNFKQPWFRVIYYAVIDNQYRNERCYHLKIWSF